MNGSTVLLAAESTPRLPTETLGQWLVRAALNLCIAHQNAADTPHAHEWAALQTLLLHAYDNTEHPLARLLLWQRQRTHEELCKTVPFPLVPVTEHELEVLHECCFILQRIAAQAAVLPASASAAHAEG